MRLTRAGQAGNLAIGDKINNQFKGTTIVYITDERATKFRSQVSHHHHPENSMRL